MGDYLVTYVGGNRTWQGASPKEIQALFEQWARRGSIRRWP